MPELLQDGVRAFVLPDDNFCLADEEHRSPLDLSECPLGQEYCSGDCFYYSENPDDRIGEEGEEEWD